MNIERPIIVVDIETVPYSEAASVWKPKLDKDGKPDPKDFPPVYVHKICTIGCVVIRGYDIATGCFQLAPKLSGELSAIEKCGYDFNFFDNERDLLFKFFDFLGDDIRYPHINNSSDIPFTLVTQNGEGFDIPVIICRMIRYGMNTSMFYNFDSALFSFDLVKQFFGTRGPKLDAISKIMGLPGKMEIDGGSVKELFDEGRYDNIASYCMTDVFQTALVYLKMDYLRQPITRNNDWRDLSERIESGLCASRNSVLNILHERTDWNIYKTVV